MSTVQERRKILSNKRLCFNCTGSEHRAADCLSKGKCQNCDAKHHTSICDKDITLKSLATSECNVIYPTVMVIVNGIKCRALLDTGAGASYASATLIKHIKEKPKRTEVKRIEMMLHTAIRKIEIFEAEISSLDGKFKLKTEISKVEKSTLLTVPNPRYDQLVKRYRHLRDIRLNDRDQKEDLPVHLIIGASDYARIKTKDNT